MQIFNILFQLLSNSLKSDTIDTNASAKEKKVTMNGNYTQYSN